MVHACQKTGKCASSKIKKIADNIDKKSAEDFAKTKHKGLPEVKKKKKKKKKSFKEWIETNHPEFEIKENVLLGLAAAVQTAAQRLRGQKYANKRDEFNNELKTKNYVEAFLGQNWDWAKILQNGIIKLVYWYKEGNEQLNEDDFYPVNVLDLPKIAKKASYINKLTKNKAPINKGIEYLKNSNYWDDNKINKFYEAIAKINKNPENFGGKDIRKTS